MTTTLLELAGIACIAAAGFLIAVPLGLLALGVGLLLIGYLLEEVNDGTPPTD